MLVVWRMTVLGLYRNGDARNHQAFSVPNRRELSCFRNRSFIFGMRKAGVK